MKKYIPLFVVYIYLLTTTRADQYLCSETEVLEYCKNPCEPTCQQPHKTPCPTFTCESGCTCGAGTIRDEISGNCVSPQYCPTVCPINEVPNDCGDECEPTCQNQNQFQCVFQNKKCICQPGLLRDLNSGKCVAPEWCPRECDSNQEWNTCTNSICRKTCKSLIIEDIRCSEDCTPGCECINGFVWDEYCKKCVPETHCPNVCGINEEWRNCSDIHCRITCQDPGPKPCPMICIPGCSCKQGFLWDEFTKQCVPTEQCFKNCGLNEKWESCSDIHCRSTCQNPEPKPCPKICTPGCSCKEGFIWDELLNQCVPTGQCSTNCGINEEWKSCSDINCRSTCQDPESKPCPKICTPGCSCKEGFLWDEVLNQCVPIAQCSAKTCDENQEWKKCSDINCRETCQKSYPILCTMTCIAGCTCKDGYIWDEYYEKCVLRGECSKVCNPNAIWSESIPTNLPTCQTLAQPQLSQNIKSPFILPKSGCVCKNGFIWEEFSQKCILSKDCPALIITTTTVLPTTTTAVPTTTTAEPITTTAVPTTTTEAPTTTTAEPITTTAVPTTTTAVPTTTTAVPTTTTAVPTTTTAVPTTTTAVPTTTTAIPTTTTAVPTTTTAVPTTTTAVPITTTAVPTTTTAVPTTTTAVPTTTTAVPTTTTAVPTSTTAIPTTTTAVPTTTTAAPTTN